MCIPLLNSEFLSFLRGINTHLLQQCKTVGERLLRGFFLFFFKYLLVVLIDQKCLFFHFWAVALCLVIKYPICSALKK